MKQLHLLTGKYTDSSAPKRLVGLHDVDFSKNPKGLHFIDLYFSGHCMLNCLYCFTDHREGKLTTQDRKAILDDAKRLGASTFVATGAGEPLLDPGFTEVVSHAHSLGMTSVIYTAAQDIDGPMAKFLFENNVSPLVKLESLDAKIHDAITRKEGSFAKAYDAIGKLIDAGYGSVQDGLTRIGVAAVYTAMNIDGLASLQEFCESKGILLMVDQLGLVGRAYENRDQLRVGKERIKEAKYRLGSWESGYVGITCIFASYGIRINQDGFVSYCTMQDIRDTIGNISDLGLEKAVELVRVAERVAVRERTEMLKQVNHKLADRMGLWLDTNQSTCPFKAADDIELYNIRGDHDGK